MPFALTPAPTPLMTQRETLDNTSQLEEQLMEVKKLAAEQLAAAAAAAEGQDGEVRGRREGALEETQQWAAAVLIVAVGRCGSF